MKGARDVAFPIRQLAGTLCISHNILLFMVSLSILVYSPLSYKYSLVIVQLGICVDQYKSIMIEFHQTINYKSYSLKMISSCTTAIDVVNQLQKYHGGRDYTEDDWSDLIEDALGEKG